MQCGKTWKQEWASLHSNICSLVWNIVTDVVVTRVSWVLMAQESMIARIYIKVYYSRESCNKSRMYFCHTQNVISATDKTDEEKWLDAEISFIFLFQNKNFWWSPFRFQCLNPKFPATTITERRWGSACVFFSSFFNWLLEISKISLVKQNLFALIYYRGSWKIPMS